MISEKKGFNSEVSSAGSAVVEKLPHDPKFKGLNPASTGRGKDLNELDSSRQSHSFSTRTNSIKRFRKKSDE